MVDMACVTVNVYMYYTVHMDNWHNWVLWMLLQCIFYFFIYIYIKIPVKCLTDAFLAKALFSKATLLVAARGCTVFWSPLVYFSNRVNGHDWQLVLPLPLLWSQGAPAASLCFKLAKMTRSLSHCWLTLGKSFLKVFFWDWLEFLCDSVTLPSHMTVTCLFLLSLCILSMGPSNG